MHRTIKARSGVLVAASFRESGERLSIILLHTLGERKKSCIVGDFCCLFCCIRLDCILFFYFIISALASANL